jgi:hypothetical protein
MQTQDQGGEAARGQSAGQGQGRVKLQSVRVVEVYTIDMDLQDERCRQDPAAYVRQVLESEGFEVNGVEIPAPMLEAMRQGGGGIGARRDPHPGWAHIVYPSRDRSYWTPVWARAPRAALP